MTDDELKDLFEATRPHCEVTAEFDRIRTLEETQHAFEETQRGLEEAVADLQARVERLESTH